MSAIVKELLRNYYTLDNDTKLDISFAFETLFKQGKIKDRQLRIGKLIVHGYSIEEIADVLDIPVRSVYWNFWALSDKIADFLGDGYQDVDIMIEVSKRLGRPLTEDENTVCEYLIGHYGYKSVINLFNFKVKDGKVTSD